MSAPFITFEGGEGCGKSTQIVRLAQTLADQAVNVTLFREPGGTEGAEEIRDLLLKGSRDRWTPTTDALLMSAARADLVGKRIVPHLAQGGWVLCDRFTDSTLAYQGYGHGLALESLKALNQFTVGALEPDLTFIFQLDPQIGFERAASRDRQADRYEQFGLPFYERVEEGYREILKNNPHRCVAIDASLDPDSIAEIIFQNVKKRFL